jgi:hypothetical protein
MTKTRSEKYRDLRDTISFDTQVEKNKRALKDFEERLNRIDPHLMDTVGNNYSDFSAEPDLSDTSHSLRPFGNISSGKTRPDAYPGEYSNPVNTGRPYAPKDSGADLVFPSGKPRKAAGAGKTQSTVTYASPDGNTMTKEELRNEIKSLFRDEPAPQNPVYEDDPEKTASIPKIRKTRKPADYAVQENVPDEEDPMDNTRRLVNIVLWMIIIVLAVILLVIVYLIFTQKPAGA